METKQLKPLGDRVLVKENTSQEEKKTSTGIIIPETVTANDVKLGTVVAVGEGLYTQNGVHIPMSVRVGDEVVLPPYGNGQTIKIAKVEYVLYRESELLGILSDETDDDVLPF